MMEELPDMFPEEEDWEDEWYEEDDDDDKSTYQLPKTQKRQLSL